WIANGPSSEAKVKAGPSMACWRDHYDRCIAQSGVVNTAWKSVLDRGLNGMPPTVSPVFRVRTLVTTPPLAQVAHEQAKAAHREILSQRCSKGGVVDIDPVARQYPIAAHNPQITKMEAPTASGSAQTADVFRRAAGSRGAGRANRNALPPIRPRARES